jgi:ParB family chromosome partitioning protein
MRRAYTGIEDLAESIKERGVLQPLRGVPANGFSPDEIEEMVSNLPDGPVVTVVIGNRRLKALDLLGDEAPLVPIIVQPEEELEQLLDMATENLLRDDPDPVSEALHYQRLLDRGLSKTQIAKKIGVSLARIDSRLLLLELPEPIQDLIASGALLRSPEPVEALLSIPDEKVMVETAKALAEKGADTKLIKATCTRVRKKLARKRKEREGQAVQGKRREYTPPLGTAFEAGVPPSLEQLIPRGLVESAAQAGCEVCLEDNDWGDVTAAPPELPPGKMPSWEEVGDAAERTCADCPARSMGDICSQCVLHTLFRYIVDIVGG